jgi:rubredoxin
MTVVLVDERGTSSTCPECSARVTKPKGRVFRCGPCGYVLAATLSAHESASFGEHESAGFAVHGGPLAALNTISPA